VSVKVYGLGDFGFALFLIACVLTCGWSPRCTQPQAVRCVENEAAP
jgi:hypothetical protein